MLWNRLSKAVIFASPLPSNPRHPFFFPSRRSVLLRMTVTNFDILIFRQSCPLLLWNRDSKFNVFVYNYDIVFLCTCLYQHLWCLWLRYVVVLRQMAVQIDRLFTCLIAGVVLTRLRAGRPTNRGSITEGAMASLSYPYKTGYVRIT